MHNFRAIIARMDLQLCHIAQLVAQRGSFAAAARHLELAPSSVSRSVAALEDQIGLRIFQRSTRVLILTEEGRVFLDRIIPLLDAFNQARDEAASLRQAPRGTVRITASVAFGHECLMPLLPRLQQELPGISPGLHLSDAPVDLLEESVNIAIRLAPVPKGDLISTRLMRTRYHVCASPKYLTRHDRPKDPQALEHHECLLYALPGFDNIWRFRDAQAVEIEQVVGGRTRISNALSMREAARLGCGPALLADWLIKDDLKDGTLINLFPEHAITATSFDTGAWILYPSRRYLPSKTRAVIDFLKANLPL